MIVAFDPADTAFGDDPNPAFERLREESPPYSAPPTATRTRRSAPLARVELQEELRALLRLAPGIELDGEPVRKAGRVIRGLERMRVTT